MSTPPLPHQKKGLSGFAIAGLGCLGLIVILFLVGGYFVAKNMPKLKEMAAEIEKDPAKAGIYVLELNPDIEVLNKDDTKREVTFKVKSSGETHTLSYDDLKDGKFTLDEGQGEVVKP